MGSWGTCRLEKLTCSVTCTNLWLTTSKVDGETMVKTVDMEELGSMRGRELFKGVE